MLQVRNDTPFVCNFFLFPDARGVDTVYVVVKATFTLREGKPAVAETQCPLVMSDEYWGEPGHSSLKYASEAHLRKPGTDVVLVGEAHAPKGRAVTSCLVSLRLGALQKVLHVFGDRTWKGGLLSPSPSSPEPFLALPLVYERAYGGTHAPRPEKGEVLSEPRNPVGTGFRGRRSASEMVGMKLPNLEDPKKLISSISDAPAPVGVGAVAPSWEPRRALAGTYDETWRTRRAPYLPLDFKPEFFQVASPGLHSPTPLTGGEPVELVNLCPQGTLRFRLPICTFEVTVRVDRTEHRPELQMETVLLEPGQERLCLLWRGAVPCDKRLLKVWEVGVRLQALTAAGGLA